MYIISNLVLFNYRDLFESHIKIYLKSNLFNRSKYDKKLEFYCFSLNYGFAALFVEQPPALPGPILNCAG